MWRPAKTTTGSASSGARVGGSRVEAPVDGHRPARALVAEPARMELGRAQRLLADADAAPLHPPADVAEAAEVVAPVLARPHLGPVDGELEAAPPADGGRGEQAEVRERAGEHEVVVAPVPQQMPEHADAEHERRQDPPPAVGVELHPRAGRDDPDARHLARSRPSPTAAASGTSPRAPRPRDPRRDPGRSARPRRSCTGRGSRRRCRSARWKGTVPGPSAGARDRVRRRCSTPGDCPRFA